MSDFFESPHLNSSESLLAWAESEFQRHDIRSALTVLASVIALGYLVNILFAPSFYENINGPSGASRVYGHVRDIYGPLGIPFHDRLQDEYGGVSKVKGMFGSDKLYISDPRAMHEVLVKAHDSVFRHPQFSYDFFEASFGPGLISVSGNMHKSQRKMLNPVFTAKHMKSLVPAFHGIAQELKDGMRKELGDSGSEELEMLSWCNKTALELIGQAGMGHTFELLQGRHSAYSVAVKRFLPILFEIAPFRSIFSLLYRIPSAKLRRSLVEHTPIKIVQEFKNIIDIQDEQARLILDNKKAQIAQDQSDDSQSDIMSVLLKANLNAKEEDRLPENQILGQMNTLIFAGHETTSGALARILEILSKDKARQSRLRAELNTISSTADYDEIHSLPYLEAICREVLRVYPPATTIERQSYKDWVVPLRYPIKGKDGNTMNEITIKKGTHIILGLREANRCKETWGEDADVFNPERWLGVMPASVAEAKGPGVYSSMMTFSGGPRGCIGFKFSLLELKIVLSTLVRSFEFSPSTTPVEWRLTGALSPHEAGSSTKSSPTMPLHVAAVV